MIDSSKFEIRLTSILVEDNKILIVKQKLSDSRQWSLPGGRLEHGETMEQGLLREMQEETGILVAIDKLLYICDVQNAKVPLIHITFLLSKIGGEISLPDNSHDSNPISDVKFVPISDLINYGFSEKFISLAMEGFPNSGRYAGDKAAIGLGI